MFYYPFRTPDKSAVENASIIARDKQLWIYIGPGVYVVNQLLLGNHIFLIAMLIVKWITFGLTIILIWDAQFVGFGISESYPATGHVITCFLNLNQPVNNGRYAVLQFTFCRIPLLTVT